MISFVILHYKNVSDTLACIKSIQKCTDQNYSIIVVDNHTLTNEEKQLLLQETPDLICNEENLGFAKGNNVGVSYAVLKYHPEFVVVLNNDIVLLQTDFLDRVRICHKKTHFDFMGPKIITDNGESVNPFPAYRTLEEVQDAIQKSEKILRIYQSRFLSVALSIYLKVKYFFCKRRHLKNGATSMYDVALHGCCLIFSKSYYEQFSDVFYPGTFLYHEEEFLEFRRHLYHLVSYYDSSIEVFHKEGASLDQAFQNAKREKLVFRYREILRSLRLLQQSMECQKEVRSEK